MVVAAKTVLLRSLKPFISFEGVIIVSVYICPNFPLPMKLSSILPLKGVWLYLREVVLFLPAIDVFCGKHSE